MRQEPLDGNSACRRRGRKQIPLFLHCVRTCQTVGCLQVREDPNVLRTHISAGWEQTSELPFQTSFCHRPQSSAMQTAEDYLHILIWNSVQHFSHAFFEPDTRLGAGASTAKCEICWPEINRLPFISPAKMGLFGFSKELQFRVCNHGKPHASLLHSKGRRMLLQSEKGSWKGYPKPRVPGWLTESLKTISSPHLGSAIIARYESSPFWSPNPI